MINAQGELAGVLFGAARGTTSGTHIGRVYQFVAPILQQLRQTAMTNGPAAMANASNNNFSASPDPYYPPTQQQTIATNDRPAASPAATVSSRPAPIASKNRNGGRSPLANYARHAKKLQLSNDRRDLLGRLPLPTDSKDESKTVVTSGKTIPLRPVPSAQPSTLGMVSSATNSVESLKNSQPESAPSMIAVAPTSAPSQNRPTIVSLPNPPQTSEKSQAPRRQEQTFVSPPAEEQYITLGQLAGSSPWEKLKTAFALVGVVFVFDQLMRSGTGKSR